MNLIRAIKTFFRDPPPVSRYEEVEPGLNIVDGIVIVEDPLRSPVRGQNCVGYHYRSYLVTENPRAPQPHIQKMKEAEIYTHFTLEMEGGTIHVRPPRPDHFKRETHREMQERFGATFHGTEDVILPGARVRIKGTVTDRTGVRTMKMAIISVMEKQTKSKGVVGDRKKRKKNK